MSKRKLTTTELVAKGVETAVILALLAGAGHHISQTFISVHDAPSLINMLKSSAPEYVQEFEGYKSEQLAILNSKFDTGEIDIEEFYRQYKKINDKDHIYDWIKQSKNPNIKETYDDYYVKAEESDKTTMKNYMAFAGCMIGAACTYPVCEIVKYLHTKKDKNDKKSKKSQSKVFHLGPLSDHYEGYNECPQSQYMKVTSIDIDIDGDEKENPTI